MSHLSDVLSVASSSSSSSYSSSSCFSLVLYTGAGLDFMSLSPGSTVLVLFVLTWCKTYWHLFHVPLSHNSYSTISLVYFLPVRRHVRPFNTAQQLIHALS